MKRAIVSLGFAALLVSAASSGARADLINVQFGITGGTSAYTGAGVLGAAGNQWNHVFGISGTSGNNIPLVDAAGAATGASLSYTTAGFFDASVDGIFKGSPYQSLLTSYMFNQSNGFGSPGTVTLSGLVPDATYELILYSVANAVGRSTLFTVDGMSEAVTPTNTQNLIQGNNYAELFVGADASGDLQITFAENGVAPGSPTSTFPEANLNGIQLTQVPVPEPSTIALVATGLFGLGLILYRRKTS
jgi:hypothetical protein